MADVFDSLSSDRPYRKAMAPSEVKENIVKGKGIDFDPDVVDAFEVLFRNGKMEVPDVIL